MTAAATMAAACSDRAPTGAGEAPPPTAGAARLAALDCAVDVRAGTMACAPSAPEPNAGGASRTGAAAGGPRLDVTVGGQNTYIYLATFGPQTRDNATEIVSGGVTVTNLMTQPLGTPDGATVTGVRVFFHQRPTVTQGTGTVEVANPDGFGTFTGASQPYFLYNEIIQHNGTSSPKTWQFRVPATVVEFRFQVYVRAQLPSEQGALRLTLAQQYMNAALHLRGVWVSGSAGYAVGDTGTILQRRETGWSRVSAGSNAQLNGVWGTSERNVYIVGPGDVVFQSDGLGTWGQERISPAGTQFNAVWGWGSGGANEVVAVGALGRVIRKRPPTNVGGVWYDWQLEYSAPGTPTLRGVWASGPNDIWAVGDNGTVIHYDGAAWRPVTVPGVQSFDQLRGVWGSGPNDVFIVGVTNTLLRFDGTSWTSYNVARPYPTASFYTSVWGTGPNDVYAVGNYGQVQHWNGSSWLFRETTYYDDFLSISGGIAVGLFNTMQVVPGRASTPAVPRILPPPRLTSVAGTSTSAIIGSTADCEGKRFSAGVQRTESFPGGRTDVAANGLAVGPSNNVRGGGVLNGCALEFSGSFRAIWAPSASSTTDTYAVGAGGAIAHKVNATTWATEASGTTQALNDVWGSGAGDVFAVGAGGTILRRGAGGSWTTMASGTTVELRGVWGTGPSDVYAVGDANAISPASGTILHYDGSTWTPMTSNTTRDLYAVWAAGPREVYAVGENSTILFFDGTRWSPRNAGVSSATPRPTLRAVGGHPGSVWIVGDQNTIVRGTR